MPQFDTKGDDGLVSEWNEAPLFMRRLHDIQTELNRVKMDLLSKHTITGQWNYSIWFNCVCALYSEGESKYKKVEKTEISQIKTVIEQLFHTCPPHSIKARATYAGTERKYILNEKNWLKIKELIELMESKVKYFNDIHGLTTKNQESRDGRSILR